MAKATKLPSGNWRVLAYSNGHRKSFTAPTKKEAEYQASQWLMEENDFDDMTIRRAMEKYIENRSSVSSPTTVRNFWVYLRNDYTDRILNMKISQVRSEDIQKEINEMSKRLAPKTVRNCYDFLRASIQAINPDKAIKVQLPQRKPIEYRLPTDNDIKKLLDNADDELKIAIMLAAMGTMREGEVCALEYEDINGTTIHIHQTMCYTNNNEYVIKPVPKTNSSDRYITYPKQVIETIGTGTGRIIKCTPRAISSRYRRIVLKLGLDMSTRFHDLRHYAASAMHAMGIPDQYIMETGGWSSDGVLKSVYRNVLNDRRKEFEDLRNKNMEDNFF